MTPRTGLMFASVLAVGVLGCGRTDPLWWIGSNAGGSETGDGDGDGDGEPPGDGDGEPPGDGDGEPPGDGDGEPPGDGDGEPPGDGDGEPPGDGDGEPPGDGDGEPPGDGDGECPELPMALAPVQTPVIFLIDQGAHMAGNLSGQTRWDAIGFALFDPMQGVSWSWEGARRLGLGAFTSFGGNAGGECPVLELVAPELVNAASMELSFAGLAPAEDNPVADALTAMIPQFAGEPGHLILITGRNPDTCASPNPQQGAGEAVLAAQAVFAAGIQTHLVAVGNLNGNYSQSLANAGAGLDPQGTVNAAWAAPSNAAGLTAALDGLLAGLGSCEFVLEPEVGPAGSSECTLELGGEPLGHADPDGWSLLASDRVQLNGAACAAFEQGSSLAMTCTCEAF